MGTVYYGRGFISNGFLILDIEYYNNDSSIFLTSSDNASDNSSIWHARLGHIGQERMTRLAREGLMSNLTKVTLSTYEHCLVGKSKRKLLGKATRASFPLQLIYSNICGPMNVRTKHGGFCFITYIDDYTRYNHVYLISYKSKALDCFR